MNGERDSERGGVVLALRFEPTMEGDPRPEEIASLLEDVEGLYRAVPAAAALGVPVAELLYEYRVTRADAAVEPFLWALDASDWRRLRHRMPFPEMEDFLYFVSRAWRRGRDRPYGPRSLLPPTNAIRVRRLSMESPLEVVSYIPAAYCASFALTRFLRALETYFNMAERIRTERVDLETKQAERRADMREAELREERAARELVGLQQEQGAFRLVDGEIRPDEDDEAPSES